MPKIFDNIEHHLVSGLHDALETSLRTDFCVGYFNLKGWKEVGPYVDNLPGATVHEGGHELHRYCRLLVGMQKTPHEILRGQASYDETHLVDQTEMLKYKRQLAQEFRDQLIMGIPTTADELALRKLSQQLKDKRVVVKLHLRHALHAKLYLTYSNHKQIPVTGFLGSSNLTLAGLVKQGELNIDVLEQDAAHKLVNWFEDRWADKRSLDITQELIEIIDTSWAADRLVPPYHIYLKIAYHLSREARAGISEFKLPKVFQEELLDFQQKAVLVAAHHLHKRGGVMIGDVVGLGKTITASALAKLFEDDFYLETLIICPKNLVTMWEGYVHQYQLRAKVISQSQVQKILPDLPRYRFVIIDESHNLRNDQGQRYKVIKAYLEKNESKVVLLSATPYNKSYRDLSNQLRLFIGDDQDLGLSPERYMKELGGQVQFIAKHTETPLRSIKAFEWSEFADDWRELMRLYLVRRTRSFIKNNYAQTDPSNGRKFLTFMDGSRSYFPDRLPKKVEFGFNAADPQDQYAKLYSPQMVDAINALQLPRYGLKNFLQATPPTKPTAQEERIMANLTRAGKRLMGFCRTNLFKRLESSGYAFLLSLKRHVLRNYIFIYAIQNHLPLPIGKNVSENLDDYLDDDDLDNEADGNSFETDYLQQAQKIHQLFSSKSHHARFDWMGSEFFTPALLQELRQDSEAILTILAANQEWQADLDRKLTALYDLLTQSHPTEKVLVFTQYADTAGYLTGHLKRWGLNSLELVTGESENPTALAHRFSPYSNGKSEWRGTGQELRVLISTDVLSEGQNLQDAHVIVNYDLPWALIRLIQRAGRVDRIGQQATQILCYSFLPEDGLEQIISLRGRLRHRIKENAEVVGSDETFFEGDPTNLKDLYNEKAGLLDEGGEEEDEVDLASFAYQIWKNATDRDPHLLKLIPDLPHVLYATKPNITLTDRQGVIVYTRTPQDNDVLAWVNMNGQIITQSQAAILRAVQCSPTTPALPKIENHHDLLRQAMEYVREDEKITGGSLGRKTGIKYRVYTRLDRYCKANQGTYFVTEELKKAVEEIYKYPLKEFARDTLARQLKVGIHDEALATLVGSLREDDKLCIINPEELVTKEPQIICSMGLMNT